jgi:hypothetical protein
VSNPRRPGPCPADPANLRSTPIKTMLTQTEAAAVLSAARARGQSASTLIRDLIHVGLAPTNDGELR